MPALKVSCSHGNTPRCDWPTWPRPVTPYYMMISQILQPELSAVVADIRSPQEAMQAASQQIEHLLGEPTGGQVVR